VSDLNIKTTATLKVNGTKLKASDLGQFIAVVPGEADIDIEKKPAASQMDNSTITVTATWDGKVEPKEQNYHPGTGVYAPGTR